MIGQITDLILKLVAQALDRRLQLGTVTGTSGNNVLLKRLGETGADVQSYRRLTSYSAPANGDIVVWIEIAGQPIVLGKLA